LDVVGGQIRREDGGEDGVEVLSGGGEGEGGGERVGDRYEVERGGVGLVREGVRPRVVSSPAVVA
jgi:hypothetical protein